MIELITIEFLKLISFNSNFFITNNNIWTLTIISYNRLENKNQELIVKLPLANFLLIHLGVLPLRVVLVDSLLPELGLVLDEVVHHLLNAFPLLLRAFCATCL